MASAAAPAARREELTRVVKFLCVGVAGYSLALTLFALFHGPLGVDYRVSAALGNAISFAANFFVNRRWTFEAHRGPMGAQAIRFATVSALATLANVIVVHLLVESGGLPEFPAEALAVVAATPVSYLGNRWWTFEGARRAVAGADRDRVTTSGHEDAPPDSASRRSVRSLLASSSLSPRAVLIALLAIIAIGGALRADSAAHPNVGYESPDERSYALLSKSLSHGDYSRPRGTENDLHWPPGAPMLFAAARKLVPASTTADRPSDVPAAYWAQALVSTLTVALVFALGALLGGALAGLLAAGLVAVYPPIIAMNGAMLSEPLGAALATGAAVLLVLALKARSWRIMTLAGALFGLLVLTRTDFLLALPLLVVSIGLLCRGDGMRPAALRACAFGAAAAVVLAPWVIYASNRSGHLVPVTSGGGSALFVGTFLPGEGTTYGMKRVFEPQLRARHPEYRTRSVYDIPAEHALDIVAARHPGASRDAALKREARRNLVKYGLGEPLAFAKMMAMKAARMWYSSYRGGSVDPVAIPIRIVHWLLIASCIVGVAALLVTRRLTAPFAVVLLLPLFTTLLHAFFVSKARYNVPVLPMFVAAGVAGLVTVFWRRPRWPGTPAS